MGKKIFLLVMVIILATGVVGCEGGTSGSALGSRQSCKGNISGGSCKGSFRKIKGTYSVDVEVTRSGFHTVEAEVTARVEEGPLQVYLKAPDGSQVSAEARPGSPVTLSGQAEGYYDSFRVYFEALEGEASGINYTIEYTYP
jgi:hypothetical protein